MTSALSNRTDDLMIVYDGQCPLCSAYTRMLRLKKTVGKVALVDARDQHPVLGEIRDQGLDLDRGMVLKMDGKLYFGADCLYRLAMLSSGSNAFNRINRWIFRHPNLSRLFYPLLRGGRNAILRLLGREKISTSVEPSIGRSLAGSTPAPELDLDEDQSTEPTAPSPTCRATTFKSDAN